MNVQSLLESANPWTDRQNEASKLVGKWESTGLLKNLINENDRNNMSVILENQARSLVNEANITGGTTSMSGGAGENWAGVALPLVRRVFGEIVAKEFVSVQPMSLPSGLVFYLDFKYSNLGLTNSPSGKAGFGTASLYGNQAELHPKESFWSREEVEMFFRGEIESAFVSKTLPVEVTQDRNGYRIRFHARTAVDSKQGSAE